MKKFGSRHHLHYKLKSLDFQLSNRCLELSWNTVSCVWNVTQNMNFQPIVALADSSLFTSGGIFVILQCDTDEIHTCCFTPNGSVFASGPAEAETTICIY